MMKEKKGLSSIIATVLLILLTVSAATFIAGFLLPWIKGQLESTKCFDYRDYFTFEDDFGYNCYVVDSVNNNNTYKISIRAKTETNETEQNVKGFGLGFFGGGESVLLTIENGISADNSDIKMLSNLTANLAIPKSGEVRSYYYNNSKVFQSAEIYSILKSGKRCDVSDSVRLETC